MEKYVKLFGVSGVLDEAEKRNLIDKYNKLVRGCETFSRVTGVVLVELDTYERYDILELKVFTNIKRIRDAVRKDIDVIWPSVIELAAFTEGLTTAYDNCLILPNLIPWYDLEAILRCGRSHRVVRYSEDGAEEDQEYEDLWIDEVDVEFVKITPKHTSVPNSSSRLLEHIIVKHDSIIAESFNHGVRAIKSVLKRYELSEGKEEFLGVLLGLAGIHTKLNFCVKVRWVLHGILRLYRYGFKMQRDQKFTCDRNHETYLDLAICSKASYHNKTEEERWELDSLDLTSYFDEVIKGQELDGEFQVYESTSDVGRD